MSAAGARQSVDEVRAPSLQRFVLTLLAIVIPPGACFLAAAVSPVHRDPTLLLFAIAFLALLSAIQPDGHLPLVTVVAVVWYWTAVVADRVSPWSMGLAALLYLFHTLITLMAMTPRSATIDRATLRRYTARSALLAVTLVATWAIVEVFDDRHAPGNAVLAGLAIVVIIAAALAVRAVSLAPPAPADAERINAPVRRRA